MSVNEEERIKQVHLQKRLEKAIEYKNSLKKFNIDETKYKDLQDFSKVLNEWVKDGKTRKGKIKIPALSKNLEYELIVPKFTYIRLRNI